MVGGASALKESEVGQKPLQFKGDEGVKVHRVHTDVDERKGRNVCRRFDVQENWSW